MVFGPQAPLCSSPAPQSDWHLNRWLSALWNRGLTMKNPGFKVMLFWIRTVHLEGCTLHKNGQFEDLVFRFWFCFCFNLWTIKGIPQRWETGNKYVFKLYVRFPNNMWYVFFNFLAFKAMDPITYIYLMYGNYVNTL